MRDTDAVMDVQQGDPSRAGADKDVDAAREPSMAPEDEPPVPLSRKKRLLAATSCVLGTELCERMAFVGLTTNMTLYLKQYMGYTAANASQLLQVFKGTVFVTPLLGAYLADAHLGRYWVILIFSTIYMLGLVGVTVVNVIPSMKPQFNAPPAGGSYGPTVAMFWVFMYLIALGSGGIKPCVGSFGGDQFDEASVHERRYRSSFFNWFYFMINLGSLVAALVVTPVQEMRGYALGFGIPAALFAVAIGLLVLGAALKLYHYVPPEGAPVRRIWRVLKYALIKNRKRPIPSDLDDLYEPPLGKGNLSFKMGHTDRMRVLEKAALRVDGGGYQPSLTEVEETKALFSLVPLIVVAVLFKPSLAEVEETKAAFSLVPLIVIAILFKMGCDPISTMLPLTGNVMQRQLGRFQVPAATMSFANPVGMLLSVVVYDRVIAPLSYKWRRPISPMSRIAFGIWIEFLALMSAGFIEFARYRTIRSSGLLQRFAAAAALNPKLTPADPAFRVPMSVWWQVIPHFLEGVSETFTNVAVLEVFFTQVSEGTRSIANSTILLAVSEGTRSIANSTILLAVGIGNYLAFALNKAVAAGTARDPWISQNPLVGHYDYYFFLGAGILAFVALLFYTWVSPSYKEKPIVAGGARRPAMSTVELELTAETGHAVYKTNRGAKKRAATAAAPAAGAAGGGPPAVSMASLAGSQAAMLRPEDEGSAPLESLGDPPRRRAAPPLPLALCCALAAALLAPPRPAAAAPCRMQNGAQHGWCGLPLELSNFQGHHKCDASVLLGRPRTYQELSQLVKASGVGHSWWPAQFCAGANSSAINVLTTEFDDLLGAVQARDLSSLISVDERAMTVTVPAGLTQRAVLEHLAGFRTPSAPDGYTLGSFSWFIDQTMGGAVATATHGSSLLYGSLSSQLKAIKFMDATGAIRDATPASDPHLWRALTASVGRLGITLELTLGIVKNEAVRRIKQDAPIQGFLQDLRALQDGYNAAKGGPRAKAAPGTAGRVWSVLRPWNDAQVFWHVPLRSTWVVTFQRYSNATAAPPAVSALDGAPPPVVSALNGGRVDTAATAAAAAAAGAKARRPGGAGALPPGAFRQQGAVPVGYAPGIELGAVYWAGVYSTWLSINVQSQKLPARRAFLSLSEMENRLYSPYNSYDQYELAVPLSRAADCMEAVAAEVYGPHQLFQGFRTPALFRFVAGEESYLSPSAGGPALYINLEDHVSYATGRPNAAFQEVVSLLRTHKACRGRLHWGKAGWPQHARCFDGAAEYGAGWCHFGCAAARLDPAGKFSSASDVWRFAAADRASGRAVADFGACCGARGFDEARCVCAPREGHCG
ncbi:MAG: POT family-domain-containing protein [Monoraphidium minutum]|nr:MAG: POT family-domain-containing protein [Monoraphidium minutum]